MTTLRYSANIGKKNLIKLAIPIFFSNLAIPLVGLVDTALMGHLNSHSFLAATSIATSVITMILWSFGFLRMGTVGLVSQSLGKGDYREIVSTILRNLTLAIIISFVIILLKYPILILINKFFPTSNETKFLIEQYISLRLFSAPAELIMYVLIGFYLGIQKTKISSLFISFYCILNIILSSYFVIFLDLNVKGVALGTVLSAYTITIIFLIFSYLYIKKKFKVIPRLNKIIIKRKILRLFNINFDIFIRTLLLTFSFLWMNYQSAKLGEDYVAINSILLQFVLFSSFFLDSYAFATEGVVGYSIGKKSKKSFLNIVRNSFELSFLTALVLSVLYIIFFKLIVNSITSLELIRYLVYDYIIWIIIIPPIASFCYQYDGIFVGASQTKEMRNAMIISVALFVLISIYLLKIFNNHGIWLSLVLFMILRSLTLNLFFFRIIRKF